MIRRVFIIISLYCCCISNLSVQARNTGNGDLNAQIRDLTSNYLEWFTLSGFDGQYNSSVEQNFQTLFSEDAVHFNFLPRSRYYLSETTLNNYIEGLKEFYQDYTVFPGIADYHIEEVIKPLNLDIYQVKVSVTNYLHVYSNDYLDTIHVSLLLEIYADLTTNSIKIVRVANNSGNFESLSFKLIDSERKPVTGLPVFFSYLSPSDKNVITRKRYSDNNGLLKISALPGNAELVINVPKGYAFPIKEGRTVAGWREIPENERLLFVHQKRVISLRNRSNLHAGINHGMFVNDLFSRTSGEFSQNKYVNFSSLNPGFFFNYSFMFFDKESFGVAAGTGINYSSFSFDSRVSFYTKSFPPEVKGEGEAYLLPFSSNVRERYFYESWNVPFFFTFRYKTNYKLLDAVDFTLSVSYYLQQSISYETDLLKTGLNRIDLAKPPIDMNNDHQYRHIVSNDGNHFSGNIEQGYPVSYSAMLSFSIPVLYRMFSIQPSIGYQLFNLGGDTGTTLNKDGLSNDHHYVPTLGYNANYIGVLGANLGLLFVF